MPIYMDRHDLPESVSAEEVARLHQEDLKIEHEFGCKGMTYWFDEERKTAFCLIQAPNKQALQDMHNHAHGAIANSIIEVDPTVVESFLGRISDPANELDQDINVINDPAFRVLMLVSFRNYMLKVSCENLLKSTALDSIDVLGELITRHKGRLVQSVGCRHLASFKTVDEALKCASEVQQVLEEKFEALGKDLELRIGLSAGVPFEEEDGLFDEAIKVADQLCEIVSGEIVITSEINELYKKKHLQAIPNQGSVRILKPSEERFLKMFVDFTEKNWNRSDLKVDDFSQGLGLSKAQLYRKVKTLTGTSLNAFLKGYRLDKALDLLSERKGNISEVAFDTGFNSPSYFSRCFHGTFGVLPSEFGK